MPAGFLQSTAYRISGSSNKYIYNNAGTAFCQQGIRAQMIPARSAFDTAADFECTCSFS